MRTKLKIDRAMMIPKASIISKVREFKKSWDSLS
jgi:hypothetical protein